MKIIYRTCSITCFIMNIVHVYSNLFEVYQQYKVFEIECWYQRYTTVKVSILCKLSYIGHICKLYYRKYIK